MRLLPVAFALAAFGVVSVPEAQARFPAPQPEAAALIEPAACTVRQVRTVRPNGRVVYRTVRRCTVDPVGRCRVTRERVFRQDGSVVIRSVRRCR
jgi:streptogramin lyase